MRFISRDAVGPSSFMARGRADADRSAVVSDLVELARNLLTPSLRETSATALFQESAIEKIPLKKMDDVVMPFYMRFSALDRPRVLSRSQESWGRMTSASLR